MMDPILKMIFDATKPPQFRNTNLGVLFSIIKDKCAGISPNCERDDDLIITTDGYTFKGVTGTFTDPYDGQTYRITIEPESEEG